MNAPSPGAFLLKARVMHTLSSLPVEVGHLEEHQLESQQVFSGHLLDVRRDLVRTPDGHEATREYVRHQGASVVIPWLEGGHLLMERQFRYPLRRAFIEFPAGKIDRGEDPLQTAQRELLEETGYSARVWRHLGTTHPCIGYSDERIEIFEARELCAGMRCLDHGEHLELLALSLEEALDAVRRGEITDGKTISGLLRAERIAHADW